MRISIWVWFVPSALFVVVAATGSAVVRSTAVPAWALACTIATVLAAAAVAALGERAGWHGTRWAVPVLLIASAAFVHGTDGAAIGSSLLLTAMPAGWLSFERGTRGAVAAAAGIWTVAATPYASGQHAVRDALQRWDDVVAVVGLTAMVLLTWHAGCILRRAQDDLVARTRSLEQEVAVTRTIFESVDAALAVFLPGDHTLVNTLATRLGHGLCVLPVTTPQRATPSDHHVVDADGVTSTAPADQALLRSQRGEEFAGLVQWTGTSTDRRAMVCSSRRILLDGRPDGAIGTVFVAWDATEALDAARVRDEFLGTLTHELRTPLTAIVGYLDLHDELALGARPEADTDRNLAGVRRNVRALADHVEDLLATARPEALDTAPFDVAALAREAVEAWTARARTAGLRLTLDGPRTLEAVASEPAVRQVLDHLLDNALTYTERGGVKVEVARCAAPFADHDHADGFTLIVTDTGIGLTEQELTRVFDRFYRTEEAVRRVLPGLGMGLAATKQLVAAHGGTITAQSTPGLGSSFRVTIPAPRRGADAPAT